MKPSDRTELTPQNSETETLNIDWTISAKCWNLKQTAEQEFTHWRRTIAATENWKLQWTAVPVNMQRIGKLSAY